MQGSIKSEGKKLRNKLAMKRIMSSFINIYGIGYCSKDSMHRFIITLLIKKQIKRDKKKYISATFQGEKDN